MKKYLLFTLLLVITLNAQSKKNYCIQKDVYHHAFQHMKEVYTRYIAKYSKDYKHIDSLLTITRPNARGGNLYTQFIDIYKYDDKGRLVETETKENIENKFVNQSKVLYTHNEKGVNDTVTTLVWDKDLNKFANRHKEVYVHNPQGKLLEVKQLWGDNYTDNWKYLFSSFYTYKDGRLYKVEKKYSEENGGAVFERTTYYYDAKGREIKDVSEKYDEVYHEFIPKNKYEINYDSEGNVSSKVSFLYDIKTDDWAPNFRFEPVKYDKTHSSSNTYSSIPGTTGILPSKYVLLSYDAFQYDGHYQKWETLTHNEIFYNFDIEGQKGSTVIEPIKPKKADDKKELKLYPNPVVDKFIIETTDTEGSIKVYDLSGRVLKVFNELDESYDVSSLKSGIYIVEYKSRRNKKRFKLIKK